MRLRPRASIVAALALTACATPRPSRNAPSHPAPTQLHYSVELDASFESMAVELCFEGSLRGGLIPGHADAFHRLKSATWLGSQAHALRRTDSLLEVPEEREHGCLRYDIDLAEGGSLGTLVERVHEHLLTGVAGWLWRPRIQAQNVVGDLRFVLPEGMRASVAFAAEGQGYRLEPNALAFDSYAAFGRFEELKLESVGTSARLALLGTLPKLDRAALGRWLHDAMEIAAESDGRFPSRRLQVLLLPQKLGNEPFGNVARGGGASVLLLVPDSFDETSLKRDWVLPHELSHLLLPFLAREDAWLSEGLATYYQELLRARKGVLTQGQALTNIASALRSARDEGTGRTLCEESRAMHQSHAYRAVYWGGAGHWLMADVALREASAGGTTLDALLSQLRAEARMSPPYSARELLTRLDELSGTQLFSALLAHCQAHPFPDVEPTLRSLGVDQEGPLPTSASALRSALFAPQAEK
jgi:hypothetical protein